MAAPLTGLRQAASDPRQLARTVLKNPRLVEKLTQSLNASDARMKYTSAKALRLISEEQPRLLFPYFDFFVHLLDHENKILQWEAAFVLSHLIRVDADDQFAAIFDEYFAPISGPVMITAANVIQGGARIARARPQWADRIATEVSKVARARYQTAECRNVAIGHAIVALGEIWDLLHHPTPVLRFVRKQLKNRRPATRKKAEQFLKRV